MADRYNLFDFPHKPFRFMWMEVVSEVGNVNYTDDGALEALERKIKFAADSYAHHNRDESEFFGPLLRRIDAALADGWVADHEHHLGVLEGLKERMRALRSEANVEARGRATEAFYRDLCRYLAEDLDHMMMEQTEIMQRFQDRHTDAELQQMERDFIAARVDPDYMKSLTPLFLRAGNIDQRTFVLGIIKSQVPAPAFDDLVQGLVASIVPAAELQQIQQRLGT